MPIVQDDGPALEPVWTLPLTGIEFRTVQPTASLLYRLRYHGSLKGHKEVSNRYTKWCSLDIRHERHTTGRKKDTRNL